MNYVPLIRGREQSPSSPAPFHNSSTLYINQQRPILHLPRPRFNVTVNGHLHPHHHQQQQQQQQHLTRAQDFPRITIRTPDIRSRRPGMPFSTLMSTVRSGNNGASTINDVQRKLAALTLRLEKELESEATVGEYFGQCAKCGQSVTGSSEACQAMGEVYHNDCFKCVVCSRVLRGKPFYRVQDQVYCEEDYLVNCRCPLDDHRAEIDRSSFILVHGLSANGRKVSHLRSSHHGQGIRVCARREMFHRARSLRFDLDAASTWQYVSFGLFPLFRVQRMSRWSSIHCR